MDKVQNLPSSDKVALLNRFLNWLDKESVPYDIVQTTKKMVISTMPSADVGITLSGIPPRRREIILTYFTIDEEELSREVIALGKYYKDLAEEQIQRTINLTESSRR